MEIRLMDVPKIMTSYGFKNGFFSDSNPVINKISLENDEKFGFVEKEEFIDTAAEFLTATYVSPIQIKSNTAKKVIEKELPKGKEGGLKLCAMWLKKKVENPEKAKNYLKVIKLIKEKSKVTDKEIDNYYAKAMTKEVNSLGKKYIGKYYSEKQLTQAILPRISDYYKNPSKDNYIKLVALYVYFYKKTEKELLDSKNLLNNLNIELRRKVMSDAYSERKREQEGKSKIKEFRISSK